MSQTADSGDRISKDDVLPPVEPPSAGFVLQLFVIPAVIVTLIVAVYMLFSWLAQVGQDPQQYVRDIKRGNANSWQAAHNLALELRRDDELRRNEQLATELAALLSLKLDTPLPTEATQRDSEVQLRVYLCRVLGEFELDAGAEVLVRAAALDGTHHALQVRRAAIDALALLASRAELAPATRDQIAEVLTASARHAESHIRKAAVYALGVLGGEDATAVLKSALYDEHTDVRYNAATGLARQGNAEELSVLVEMLDPEEDAAIREEIKANQPRKRGLVILTALRTVDYLAKVNPTADLAPLAEAVEHLTQADLTGRVPPDVARMIGKEAGPLLKKLRAAENNQASDNNE